jgi:uncharacterized glyoxalase superfamily protein PhnB
MTFENSVPVIGTADVAGTVRYFEEKLGFEKQWAWGEPPVYAGMKAGNAIVYIGEDLDLAGAIREKNLKPDLFLWTTDIEAAYAQHRAQGAEIVEELAEKPWGVRQYTVREPNGYLLKIAESD